MVSYQPFWEVTPVSVCVHFESLVSHQLSGHITWGGKNFSKNARNIFISSDGPKHIPTLHCDLAGPDGKYVSREIDLADHIANIDGELVVLPY